MQSENQIKKDIIEVGRRIYQKGFVAANDGNISVRTGEHEVLTTATGMSKGFMTPEMIAKVDLEGRQIEGEMKPSSELKMHLDIYQQRPEVGAVIHAHPPAATAFAVAGIPLDKPLLPEFVITLGAVPLAKYGTPSTKEIPDNVRAHLDRHDAVLLENHGALAMGEDVFSALFKMEIIEHFALVSMYSRFLGNERALTSPEVVKLLQVREKMGMGGRHPGYPEYSSRVTPKESKEKRKKVYISENRLMEIVTRVVREVLSEE